MSINNAIPVNNPDEIIKRGFETQNDVTSKAIVANKGLTSGIDKVIKNYGKPFKSLASSKYCLKKRVARIGREKITEGTINRTIKSINNTFRKIEKILQKGKLILGEGNEDLVKAQNEFNKMSKEALNTKNPDALRKLLQDTQAIFADVDNVRQDYREARISKLKSTIQDIDNRQKEINMLDKSSFLGKRL